MGWFGRCLGVGFRFFGLGVLWLGMLVFVGRSEVRLGCWLGDVLGFEVIRGCLSFCVKFEGVVVI